MKAYSHYADVRCLSMDGSEVTGSDIAFAMSRMFKVVHDMKVNQNVIAIDLPELRSGSGGASLGAVMRIFGDETSIARFLSHAAIKGLIVANGILVSATLPVPVAQKWAVLSRDRKGDREQIGWVNRSQRRLERRAIARGDNPARLAKLKQREERLVREIGSSRSQIPFVNLTSRSNGLTFRLFLTRKVVDRYCGTNFDSYGLAERKQNDWEVGGCVPMF